MKTQINLTIEKDLIHQVKCYASEKHTRVSDLEEEYFSPVAHPVKNKSFIDLIKSLPKSDINDNLDFEKRTLRRAIGQI